jgi:NAD(P)-dependent dehydrogenase (short-subunit alcohol dehydrogenase family)
MSQTQSGTDARTTAVKRFDGKVAVITGAASGIGKAVATRLAAEGARIVAVDRDAARLQAFLDEQIAAHEAGHVLLACDLRKPADAKRVIEETVRRVGRIDIILNSAGVCHFKAMKDIPDDEWDETMEVNVRAMFLLSVAAAEAMDAGRGGRIINIGSNAGRKGRPLSAHYAVSKAAVANLTESLALSYGKKNITANTVCPAVTDTPMWNNLFDELHTATGKTKTELVEGWTKITPLGRLGKPEDIANLITFLASDEAAFITGQTINVCGGFMLTC